MNQQTIFSQESLLTMSCAIMVLLFFVGQIIAKVIIKSILENGQESQNATPSQLQMYLRAVSADSLLRFASLLLWLSATLTLALGWAKVFSELTRIILPEHTLGFSILIGYCGMINIYRVLTPDIVRAAKKLFSL